MPQALSLFSVASLGLHRLGDMKDFPITVPEHTLKVLTGSSAYRENQEPIGNQSETILMDQVVISKLKSLDFLSELFILQALRF